MISTIKSNLIGNIMFLKSCSIKCQIISDPYFTNHATPDILIHRFDTNEVVQVNISNLLFKIQE
jgi:hypothetical protein